MSADPLLVPGQGFCHLSLMSFCLGPLHFLPHSPPSWGLLGQDALHVQRYKHGAAGSCTLMSQIAKAMYHWTHQKSYIRGSTHLCEKRSAASLTQDSLISACTSERNALKGLESNPAHFPSHMLQRQPVHRLTVGPNMGMKLVLLCCSEGQEYCHRCLLAATAAAASGRIMCCVSQATERVKDTCDISLRSSSAVFQHTHRSLARFVTHIGHCCWHCTAAYPGCYWLHAGSPEACFKILCSILHLRQLPSLGKHHQRPYKAPSAQFTPNILAGGS